MLMSSAGVFRARPGRVDRGDGFWKTKIESSFRRALTAKRLRGTSECFDSLDETPSTQLLESGCFLPSAFRLLP
jgi:hypothetical protein